MPTRTSCRIQHSGDAGYPAREPCPWPASSALCRPMLPDCPPTPRSSVTICRPCPPPRSEEHKSELQSRGHLVCRLLLEKQKQTRAETSHLITMKSYNL